ncbi:YhgE/Pip domain-containing protein [Curtobacterium flaccumfaciens]|nr:YhgE/Pip domain-containing protein [Curtobacterium flaccumfaciens]
MRRRSPTARASCRRGRQQLAAGTKDLPAQTSKLNDGAQQVASGAGTLSSGLQSAKQQTASLPADTAKLNDGAQQVAAGNKELADTVDSFSGDVDGLQPVDAKTVIAQIEANLPDGVTLSEEQTAAITKAVSDVNTAGAKAKTTYDATKSSVDQLRDGSAQVAAGTQQLASKSPELASGIATAADGAAQLASGSSQVASGTSQLATAAPTLSSGASQLATGAASADDGAKSLASGLGSLRDGSSKLADELDEGRTRIPASTASQRNDQASVISDPVKVGTDDIASASNYGAGLAPFFISLAAWIGMYALFLILKPISKRAITAVRRPLSVVLGGWLTPVLLGVVQMVALFFIVRFALDLNVVHAGATIGIMVLASATFAAIIMALNVLLGSVGQFLGLVLMLVQLVTAGGTFPWQTLPGPLAALHFALPMTYSVDAIRQTMYGGSLGTAWSDAGVLACWLLGSLLVAFVVTARQTRSRTLRDLRPSLIG